MVYESLWGNTAAVAQAILQGLAAQVPSTADVTGARWFQ